MKQSAEYAVETILLREIMSGQLKAGELLRPERELSEALGFSRPVVHKAIIRLEGKGLLTIIPRRGVRVKDYRIHGRLGLLDSIYDLYRGDIDSTLKMSMLGFIHDNLNSIVRRVCDRSPEVRQQWFLEQQQATLDSAEDLFAFFHRLSLYADNAVYPMLLNEFETGIENVGRALFEDEIKAEFVIAANQLNQSVREGDSENSCTALTALFTMVYGVWFIKGGQNEK